MSLFSRFPIIILLIVNCAFSYSQQSQLNDEFNSLCNMADWLNITEVEGWMTPAPNSVPAEHLEEWDISGTHPGQLYMKPWSTSWYRDLRGALIFKEITGDFVFTTRIIVRDGDGLDQLPSNVFSLAGMMIREPKTLTNGIVGWQPLEENYVFLSIGRADNRTGPSYELEVKNTTNSGSALSIFQIARSDLYMRMVKVNGTILVLRSINNVDWVLHARYNRSDFPETMQIGYVTYTDWPRINAHWSSNLDSVRSHNTNILNDDFIEDYGWDPDLVGRFEFSRFEDVNLPPENQNTNFNSANEALILSLFGHPSVPAYPAADKVWNGSQDSDWMNPLNWSSGIPESGDDVLIPNCTCNEVEMPVLAPSTPVFSSFRLESGASLMVPVGRSLNIDLENEEAMFVNEGTIENHGSIIISNSAGKTVRNVSELNINTGSVFRVE